MNKLPNQLHIPVLLERCLDWIRPSVQSGSPVIVDATLGMGGHSEAMLAEFPNVKVIGFDRDPEAIAIASQRLQPYGDRFVAVNATYDQLTETLKSLEIPSVAAVLMDLGVSSLQLDESERGFAYAQDAPLDMRMDQRDGQTAADILNSYSEPSLTRIFREYGEERFAARVAAAVVERRSRTAIQSSGELNEIANRVIPQVPGKQSGHPAKRIYQALRVAVNNEFEILESALPQAIAALQVGGRLVVMSYHSIEDAFVKAAMQDAATSKTPADFPIELPGTAPILKILTRGVERASERELDLNPRAASARLRVAEKLESR